MIIDDDQAFVADLLRLWSPPSPAMVASNSHEAIALLALESPDLILLDLCMPHALASLDHEEGLGLLRRIRAELQCRCPVIVITGGPEAGIKERALELGADAMLKKPLDVRTLEREIVRIRTQNVARW